MLNQPIRLFGDPVFGFSKTTDSEVYDLEGKAGAHHYQRLNLVVRTAQGSWITDVGGKKYLDCLAAYSAANLGPQWIGLDFAGLLTNVDATTSTTTRIVFVSA